MAFDYIPQYSQSTPGSNTDVKGVSIAENFPAANINNAMRAMLSQSKQEVAYYDTVASAATVDITASGAYSVTGTTTITAFTVVAGSRRRLVFSGALTLTHNASTLILPTGANIVTAAGDCLDLIAHSANQVTVTGYQRASGKALAETVSTTQRDRLTTNRTYYVRSDGSDSNNGLANTAGGAWLTLQKAWDTIQDTLDLCGYVVTVQVGDGTYTGPLTASGFVVGQESAASIVFQGNSGTPTNVVVNATSPASGATIALTSGAQITVKDMQLRSTTSGQCLQVDAAAQCSISNLNFGACAAAHISVGQQGFVNVTGNYTISGSAAIHWSGAFPGALIICTGRTVTVSGTPAFSTAFANASQLSEIYCPSVTFSGSATGTRYSSTLNAVINTGGGGANYLPGNAAGSTATGGQYA